MLQHHAQRRGCNASQKMLSSAWCYRHLGIFSTCLRKCSLMETQRLADHIKDVEASSQQHVGNGLIRHRLRPQVLHSLGLERLPKVSIKRRTYRSISRLNRSIRKKYSLRTSPPSLGRDTALQGHFGTFWGWALQGHSGVGHSRDRARRRRVEFKI